MFLDYTAYVQMGGSLDETAFPAYERKAEYLIRAQAGGQTGTRIDSLQSVPQAVIDCTYELISILSANPANKQLASESQSQGGTSESYSYVTRTDEQLRAECENIIADMLNGGGVGYLLYRGVYYEN